MGGEVVAPVKLTIHCRGLRTWNELNGDRVHWAVTYRRREKIKEAVTYALIGHRWLDVPRPTELAPWLVRLVRLGPRELDDDGLTSSLKSVRDAFARFVGVDDRKRDIVQYAYAQEKIREFGVRIEVRGCAV